jgi:hypothetical protein
LPFLLYILNHFNTKQSFCQSQSAQKRLCQAGFAILPIGLKALGAKSILGTKDIVKGKSFRGLRHTP